MAAESDTNEEKPQNLPIIPAITEVTEPIYDLQKKDDDVHAPENSSEQGPGNNCSFTEQAFVDKADEFEIADSLLPALDFEQSETHIEKETGVQDHIKGSTRFAWIGVGHCGTRLAKSFYELGYRKVLAVDTSPEDLASLDIPDNQKSLMFIRKDDLVDGLEISEQAVQPHKQDILNLAREIFGAHVDHIMITFGAGGDTAGASVPGLIDVAKRYARYIGLENPAKRVGAIMTLPAVGKVTPKVVENSQKIASRLTQMASAGKISPLVIIDNDKIKRMHPGMTSRSFHPTINANVAKHFDLFNRLSALSSPYTSFDPLDYQSILQAGGCAIMALATVKKLDDPFAISEAVQNSLNRTLCAGGFDLATAKEAGCIIVGGKDLMTNVKGLQDNINYAFDVFSEIATKATIHRGIYEDNSDSLRVCTLVGGLNSPDSRLQSRSTDLYFRMSRVKLKGPPLHQRKQDILPLAEYFLAKLAQTYREPQKFLTADVEELLVNYGWPGDVGELENAMQRAYSLTPGDQINPDALPFQIIFSEPAAPSIETLHILDQARRDIITRVLEFTKGRLRDAAGILGIEHNRLRRLIKKLNVSLRNKKTVTEE